MWHTAATQPQGFSSTDQSDQDGWVWIVNQVSSGRRLHQSGSLSPQKESHSTCRLFAWFINNKVARLVEQLPSGYQHPQPALPEFSLYTSATLSLNYFDCFTTVTGEANALNRVLWILSCVCKCHCKETLS